MYNAILLVLLSPILLFAGNLSLAEPYFIWKKKQVITCWQDDKKIPRDQYLPEQLDLLDFTPKIFTTLDIQTKKIIEEKITAEFTLKTTGIEFIGWKSCHESANWDLMMLASNGDGPYSGQSLFGQGATENDMVAGVIPDLSSRKSLFYFSTYNYSKILTRDQSLIMNVLHEFGHIAGLRHEHAREESAFDPMCGEHYNENPILEYTQVYGNYDPTSIMNYCLMSSYLKNGLELKDAKKFSHLVDSKIVSRMDGKIKFNIGLSLVDIKTLQSLYLGK